jgi:predicted ribosomally synthesized peptide with SipW-like signal peptide
VKRILFSVLIIGLAISLVGGAFAYFTDTQTSTSNVFTAGNTILEMANSSGVFSHSNDVVIGGESNMAPGHEYGPYTVYFKNAGSINGFVTAVVSYTRNASTDAYAQKLVVSNASANGSINVAPYWALQIAETAGWSWAQAVAAGYIVPSSTSGLAYPYLPTIYGLQTIVLHFSPYQGPSTFTDATLAPGAYHYEMISIMLDASAGNEFQNNSMPLTVTGTLTSN